MRVLLVTAMLLAGGCRDSAAAGPPAPACPPGTRADGRRDAAELEVWCTDGAGVRQGPYERWSADGIRLESGAYAGGERDGDWAWWYDSGRPRALARFRAGRQVGVYLELHGNGRLHIQVPYAGGRMHGPAGKWHDNGRPMAAGRFESNRKVGLWTYWDRDGARIDVRRYPRREDR